MCISISIYIYIHIYVRSGHIHVSIYTFHTYNAMYINTHISKYSH